MFQRHGPLSGRVKPKNGYGGLMTGTDRFTLGADVNCRDGQCGLLHSLVVDLAGRQLAHLVVEPEHRIGLGRLVPIGLVGSTTSTVELGCDLAEFNALALAESTQIVQDLGAGYIFLHSEPLLRPEVHEVLPEGEAGLGSGTLVLATDGPVGKVAGLLSAPDTHLVTAILVNEERHLWGRKMVAVPVSAVAGYDDGVRLNMSAAELGRVVSPSPN